jgi:hypothetical protein
MFLLSWGTFEREIIEVGRLTALGKKIARLRGYCIRL